MRRAAVVAGMSLVLLGVSAQPSGADFLKGPAEAGIVVRFEGRVGILTFDFERGLIASTGVAHEDVVAACAGEEEAFQPISDQFVFTPTDAVLLLELADDLSIFVYEIPPPPFDPFEDICDLFTMENPLATGSGRFQLNDNDFFVSGGRTNSFGWRTIGLVTDQAGTTFHYTSAVRLKIDRNGEFTEVVSFIRMT